MWLCDAFLSFIIVTRFSIFFLQTKGQSSITAPHIEFELIRVLILLVQFQTCQDLRQCHEFKLLLSAVALAYQVLSYYMESVMCITSKIRKLNF